MTLRHLFSWKFLIITHIKIQHIHFRKKKNGNFDFIFDDYGLKKKKKFEEEEKEEKQCIWITSEFSFLFSTQIDPSAWIQWFDQISLSTHDRSIGATIRTASTDWMIARVRFIRLPSCCGACGDERWLDACASGKQSSDRCMIYQNKYRNIFSISFQILGSWYTIHVFSENSYMEKNKSEFLISSKWKWKNYNLIKRKYNSIFFTLSHCFQTKKIPHSPHHPASTFLTYIFEFKIFSSFFSV